MRQPLRRRELAMADGRGIIYFDEHDDLTHDAADQRVLPPPPPASQLRYDPLMDEWVAVAAHRQERTFLPPADECPLCPSAPGMATEIPTGYDVVVFENRFPSFSDREPWSSEAHLPPWNSVRPARGRCEVVCFTPDHDASFASLPPSRVRTVLDVLVDRTEALSRLPDVEQVFCFENRGVEIGVTLHHPHGQIYAYPFVTPRTRTMLASARRHAAATGGRSLFGDLLAEERSSGERVVLSNAHWTAFVPAAARWPFEVFVAPHRQLPDLASLSADERDAFGPLYLDLLQRLDLLFGVPMPYVSAWHQAPVRTDRELAYLHLQLFSVRRAPDKLKFLAGSESAMGVFVNDVVPEDAARMLRDARR
jgi:UDPglucose--hexose-1-phosphate uridylyltransferase